MREVNMNEKGLTLAELLVTMVVMGIIMTMIMTIFITQRKSFETRGKLLGLRDRTRASLDYVTKNLRMAGYDRTGVDAGFTGGGRYRVSFTADINDDTTLGAGETFNFFINGDTLMNGAEVVSFDIDSLQFTYFDASRDSIIPGAGDSLDAAQRAEVQSIKIFIKGKRNIYGEEYSYRLSSFVNIRNK